MPLKIVFSPDAQNDLMEIYDWYETTLPGLGERFIDETEKKLFQIARTPGIGNCSTTDADFSVCVPNPATRFRPHSPASLLTGLTTAGFLFITLFH